MYRLKTVTIENIKAIESARFGVGTLTVLVGRNGSGKSSIESAIRCIFSRWHDPGLLRIGADSGSVVLEMEDGTIVSATVTRTDTVRKVHVPGAEKDPPPREFIDDLAKGFAFDPVAFLTADHKKRTEYLLDAMPVTFAPEEVTKITGKETGNTLSLAELDALRKLYYEERTKENRTVRDAEGTLKQLRAGLPSDASMDWRERVAALQSERDAKIEERRDTEKRFGDEAERLVDAARARRDAAIEQANRDFETAQAQVYAARAEKVREETAAILAELETLNQLLADANQNLAKQQKAEEAKTFIQRQEEIFRDAQAAAEDYSDKIDAIDQLREKALASTLIPGLRLSDDGKTWLYNGIPFDHLNTQMQWFVAFQIGSLCRGKLPLMVSDKAESLVGEQWEAFKAAAAESGFQVILARAEEVDSTSGSLPGLYAEVDGEAVPIEPAPETSRKRKRR